MEVAEFEKQYEYGLHHLADLTVEQVADTLGLPTGTVKARLSRGRAALSALLVKEEPHV